MEAKEIANVLKRLKENCSSEESIEEKLMFQFNLLASLNAELLTLRRTNQIAENTKVMCEIIKTIEVIKNNKKEIKTENA